MALPTLLGISCSPLFFDNNITISIPHTMLTPLRENDKSLMSLASSIYTDKSSLRAINRVCMFHVVVHLSDVCNANGNTLDRRFLSSHKFPDKKITTNGHYYIMSLLLILLPGENFSKVFLPMETSLNRIASSDGLPHHLTVHVSGFGF